MSLSKGFRAGSAATPIDFRLAQAGAIIRTSGGVARQGILHAPTANGNILVPSASALQVTLVDQAVMALSRNPGTDGVDVLTNAGALVQAINAPTANSWYAVIWVRQNDTTGAGGAVDPNSSPTLGVTYGAAAASPAIPAVPTGATKIGHMLVPTGAATATSAGVVYTETILHTATVGGSIRYRSMAEMTGDVANLPDGVMAYIRSGDAFFLKGGVWIDVLTILDLASYNTDSPIAGNPALVIKTGVANSNTGSGGTQSSTFRTPFPTACIAVIPFGYSGEAAGNPPKTTAVTRTGFSLFWGSRGSSAVSSGYLALGY